MRAFLKPGLVCAFVLGACAMSAPVVDEPVAAAVSDVEKVSAPGSYSGYAEAVYDGYERSSFYIPMRDGTRLAADLFRPTKGGVVASEKLPVVWMHTPYNRRTYRGEQPTAEAYPGYALKLAPYGYNVAVVDFRGLYASFGKNVAFNRGEWVEDVRWDAYDVTEWFAAQPWSNGRIGMWGCSATGGSQMQALTTRPPSLKAVIPMSAEFDAYPFTTLGGVSRAPSAAPGPGAAAPRDDDAAAVDGPDGEALRLQAIASHAGNVGSPGYIPFYDSVSDTTGLKWWEVSAPATYLDALRGTEIGVLSVANWDEAGTKHGPFFTFNNLNPTYTKLLVGPEQHCAWSTVQEGTGFDLVTEELRFFDHWLKGVDNGVMEEPAVTYYTYNAPEASQWRTSEAWPLAAEQRTKFYLSAEGLQTAKVAASHRKDVAFGPVGVSSSILITPPGTGGAVYQTGVLERDLEITGHPVMNLWVSTKAKDVDATVQLDDVAPDGTMRSYQMLGRLRASHRAVGTPPFNYLGLPWMSHREGDVTPLPAGAPVQLTFEMLPMSYIFKAGHKLQLRVTFADPGGADTSPTPVTIISAPDYPSYVTLPVIATD